MRRAMVTLLLALGLVGCQQAPLLSEVAVTPADITPNQDGDTDVARITYRIGAPASLSITLESPDGATHTFRDNRPRSPGTYEALFGGVIDGRMLPDGDYVVRFEALPRDGSEGAAIEERRLSMSGGDTTPPELPGLSVQPTSFTPNQDGLGDRVAISYALDEPTDVRVWLETADGEYVADILEEQDSAEDAGAVGPHVYDYDAGVDADAPPPPDGEYVVVAEARDGAGNVTLERLPLTIRDGGQPRAALIGDVEWSNTIVPLGDTLTFTATVKNVGATPIRTRGPEPGAIYDNTATFNRQAPAEWLLLARDDGASSSLRVPYERAGAPATLDLSAPDRSGLAPALETTGASEQAPGPDAPTDLCGTVVRDGAGVPDANVYAFEADGDNGIHAIADDEGRFCFEGLPVVPDHQRTYARSPGVIRLGLEDDARRTDVAYPYRWQLGRTAELDVCRSDDVLYLCLPPDKTVTVTGGVRFVEPPFRRGFNAYLALMHEDVSRMHGPYNPERITVEH